MTQYDEAFKRFIELKNKYPYTPDAKIGIQIKLSRNLKVVRPSENYICLTSDNVHLFVKDIIEHGFKFVKEQTKSTTKNGMIRFLRRQFKNTELKAF
jgi:hypothetical protein